MPLLEGLNGVNKMSKSLDNYIGITEPPQEIFGKLMSISDQLMWRYIYLLSLEPVSVIEQWKKEVEQGRNPRDVKVGFAQEIVRRFHDNKAAEQALMDFEARFKQGAIPDNLPEITLKVEDGALSIAQVLKFTGLSAGTSEAMRMIDQGGVKLNGEKVSDKKLSLAKGQTVVLQVGKRKFAKVTLI